MCSTSLPVPGAGEEAIHLPRPDDLPFTRAKPTEPQVAHACASQPQHLESHLLAHAPNLAVAPLPQHEAKARVRLGVVPSPAARTARSETEQQDEGRA